MATLIEKGGVGDEVDKETMDSCLSSISGLVDPVSRECVTRFLEAITLGFDEKEEVKKAESWIDWAKRLNYLKLVETDVPDFVLPKHCSGELIDVKVFCKRGPDDQIYDNYKMVRQRVARGNCFLRITKGPHRGTRCILYALKKFTGGLGDDDDRDKGDNHTWKKYFTKDLSAVKKIIATRKANGEAAHLSCICIDGQTLICAGSKNVHMLIRNRADIAFYKGDRYRIATEVCNTIMDCLEEMDPAQRERLLNFLVVTRFTAVFEILSPLHQHVEDLSDLTKPVLQFITWTKTELEPKSEDQLCTVPPHVGIEIARALGLKTIEYEEIKPSDLESRMKKIRQGYQYEGEVLYFLDDQDHVMGLLKKKTVWYIVCRAIREKARNSLGVMIKSKSTFSVSKAESQVGKRLVDIKSWLGLDDEAVAKWKELGVGFLKWCFNRYDRGQLSVTDIADQFPKTWKTYLEENGHTDNIPVDCTDELADGEGEAGSQEAASSLDGASALDSS